MFYFKYKYNDYFKNLGVYLDSFPLSYIEKYLTEITDEISKNIREGESISTAEAEIVLYSKAFGLLNQPLITCPDIDNGISALDKVKDEVEEITNNLESIKDNIQELTESLSDIDDEEEIEKINIEIENLEYEIPQLEESLKKHMDYDDLVSEIDRAEDLRSSCSNLRDNGIQARSAFFEIIELLPFYALDNSYFLKPYDGSDLSKTIEYIENLGGLSQDTYHFETDYFDDALRNYEEIYNWAIQYVDEDVFKELYSDLSSGLCRRIENESDIEFRVGEYLERYIEKRKASINAS